jgi:hypothetical protein
MGIKANHLIFSMYQLKYVLLANSDLFRFVIDIN